MAALQVHMTKREPKKLCANYFLLWVKIQIVKA
jgi:hypothetical protein